MVIRRLQEVYGNVIEIKTVLDNNGNIIGFPDDNNDSASFKFKQKITGQTGHHGTKNVEIMVPLKYLSNFWRTLGSKNYKTP